MKSFTPHSSTPGRLTLSVILSWLPTLAVLAAILGIDLLTKFWAATIWQNDPLTIFPWFEFTYSENTGIAFGLPLGGPLLLGISVILIGIFLIYMIKTLDLNRLSNKILLGCVIGGAMGNAVDRFLYGFVRDFIQIGWWPTFNIADMAIVSGLTALIFILTFSKSQSGSFR